MRRDVILIKCRPAIFTIITFLFVCLLSRCVTNSSCSTSRWPGFMKPSQTPLYRYVCKNHLMRASTFLTIFKGFSDITYFHYEYLIALFRFLRNSRWNGNAANVNFSLCSSKDFMEKHQMSHLSPIKRITQLKL